VHLSGLCSLSELLEQHTQQPWHHPGWLPWASLWCPAWGVSWVPTLCAVRASVGIPACRSLHGTHPAGRWLPSGAHSTRPWGKWVKVSPWDALVPRGCSLSRSWSPFTERGPGQRWCCVPVREARVGRLWGPMCCTTKLNFPFLTSLEDGLMPHSTEATLCVKVSMGSW
jgi:hypothetical protein